MYIQKQPSKGVLKKRYSENMQQIYRRAPMPKCNFNKVASKWLLVKACDSKGKASSWVTT